MSSQRCPGCGLVNWSDAANCKRCKAVLQEPIEAGNDDVQSYATVAVLKPQRVLGFMLIVWGALIIAAGVFIYRRSGEISSLLFGGPTILLSGILVMCGRDRGVVIYFAGVIVMCLWLGSTNGPLAAIIVFVYPGFIGLLLARRRFPVLAGLLILIACLALLAPFMIAGFLIPQKVAWQDFRPNQGLFLVKMPSAPIARDPIVQQRGPYSMTKHLYQSQIAGQGSVLYGVVDYSPALPTEKVSYAEMLDAEVTAIVNGTSSTLVSKHNTIVSGYDGVEFEMKPPDNFALKDARCFVKLFGNSEHLYLLQITASESSELLAGKEFFLNPEFSYRSSR